MAWIRTVSEAAADDELTELYDEVRDPRTGQLDNILQIHSLDPGGLAAHFQLYSAVMRSSRSLRKVERELIALVVSRVNDCHY
jgi:alkylhydroperoxidase family enzyme